MKRLLLLLFLPLSVNAAVIKNDTFTVASDTPLENHTSDSGGGWANDDAPEVTVNATLDAAVNETTIIKSPIGDENPSETDYFAEVTGTLGGTAGGDWFGVTVRATDSQALGDMYYFTLRGSDGWRLRRKNTGQSLVDLDFDTGYNSANSIGAATVVKLKLEVTGTGATVNLKAYIDPDGGGYDLVSDTDDTSADRLVAAGNPGIYLQGTNAAITEFNAEDFASSAPAFDTNPAESSVTDSTITLSYDADATADNIQCMATDTAASAPAASAIEAQTGSHGYATEATTGSADSITVTLTDAPEFPVYDVHCVLEEGTSNYGTVVTVSDIDLTAATGEQFVQITSIGTGSPCEDFNAAATPDIVANDWLRAPDSVSPGGGVDESLTIGADCQFSYDGDNTGQQKAFDIGVYDVSAGDYHAEDIDFLANNAAPVCSSGETFIYDLNEAIATLDLDSYCDDPDEQVTYALESGGTHTGSANAATLTDSSASFVTDSLIGLTIDNDTDGSSCTITDNDATTVTCTLSGGSENDWDTSDAYTITYVLPTGLSLNTSNGEVTGTPTVEDEDGTVVGFTGTDIGEESDTVFHTFYVIDTWTMPDITGGTVSAGLTAIENAAPWNENVSISTSGACSTTVAEDDIISQTPEAGEVDDPEPEFSAVVSTGACPTFDLTGLPLSGDWEPWIDVLKDPDFIAIKQQECDGDGTWASWLSGTNPTPRGSANCVVDEDLIREEANGSAQWARWAPGANIKNSANLQIDIREALSADFVPN